MYMSVLWQYVCVVLCDVMWCMYEALIAGQEVAWFIIRVVHHAAACATRTAELRRGAGAPTRSGIIARLLASTPTRPRATLTDHADNIFN